MAIGKAPETNVQPCW